MVSKPMTRVLILGGAGMLGHTLWQRLKTKFDTFVTLRRPLASYSHPDIFDPERTHIGIDAENAASLKSVLESVRPQVVINCIGIIKQLQEAKDLANTIKINSLFPHILSTLLQPIGAKLIHISTDCVFSGEKGNYTEEDLPDAGDWYGRSKLLGEVAAPPHLTLRTSIIGHELGTHHSLLEWLLSQPPNSQLKGYTNAFFSGFTTLALAQILAWIIKEQRDLTGLYHLAAPSISKFDLLKKLQSAFKLDMEIAPFEDFQCNRILDGSRFNRATGFTPPSWDAMINELEGNYASGR